jgi:hypothetical protein
MIFSHKVYDSIYLTDSSDSENELDATEIEELEQKLLNNYKLLKNKKKEIKNKKKDNYLLESVFRQYNEIDELMTKEQNKLIQYLQLLNKYIKQNKVHKKNMFLLENEKKNIKAELKKINSI